LEDRLPFIGEYELTIDDKNRLLIPSDIRSQLDAKRDGEAFVLKVAASQGGRRLQLHPENAYKAFLARSQPEIDPSDPQRQFLLKNYALAARIVMDRQGRILLPEKAIRRTDMSREVVLLGAGDHLELWNRKDWDIEFERLLTLPSA